MYNVKLQLRQNKGDCIIFSGDHALLYVTLQGHMTGTVQSTGYSTGLHFENIQIWGEDTLVSSVLVDGMVHPGFTYNVANRVMFKLSIIDNYSDIIHLECDTLTSYYMVIGILLVRLRLIIIINK